MVGDKPVKDVRNFVVLDDVVTWPYCLVERDVQSLLIDSLTMVNMLTHF